MTNYQQILTDLSLIAYHHEQVRSFGFGTIDQITNDINTKQEPEYIRAFVIPGVGVLQQNQISYKFSIIIMDKVEQDLSNLRDVMSDTLDVAMDFWTVLYQSYTEASGNFSWYIVGDEKPEIIPFTEKYETTLGGYTLNINIVMPFDYNICTPPVLDNFQFPEYQAFKSLRLVIDTFEQFANLHEQIKSFGFGEIEMLTNDIITQKEPKYSRFYVLLDTATMRRGNVNLAFKIIIADKLEEDLSNQEDVLNDTMEIAKDFFAKLYLSDWEGQWGTTCEPFLSWYETYLGGWALSVSFTQKFDENRCVLPVTSFSQGITWAELNKLWKLEAQKWAEVKKLN
jgi:hypothetical protein